MKNVRKLIPLINLKISDVLILFFINSFNLYTFGGVISYI